MTIPALGRGGLPAYAPTSSTATATNGSRTVTFTGTALQSTNSTTNAIEYAAGLGDAFVVPNIGTRLIESVDSPTQITLCDPWSAATQIGVANWYIIRNSVPAFGSAAKAIADLLAMGTDTTPDTSRTIDDGTARLKLRDNSGNPQVATGATGAADGALHGAIQITEAGAVPGLPAGSVQFPFGVKEYVLGFRNRVINGGFRVWQRGATFSVPAGTLIYTADRWLVYTGATTAGTASKVAAPAGFRTSNAINLARTGLAAGDVAQLLQRFEGDMLTDLDNQPCTFSFDLNATTTAGSLSGFALGAANTALDNGTFSTSLFVIGFTIPVGTGRIVIPLSAAQTVGIKNGMEIRIQLLQNTSSGNLSATFGAAQLEKGVVANDFEFRPYQVELAMCLRYCYVQTPTNSSYVEICTAMVTGATTAGGILRFPLPMRATPTFSFGGALTDFIAFSSNPLALVSPTAFTSTVLSKDSAALSWTFTGSTAFVLGHASLFTFANNLNGSIKFEAEL